MVVNKNLKPKKCCKKNDTAKDLVSEIKRMKAEKNAVILGHYYVSAELQDISDFLGDSLALSQEAARTTADIIVFLGVNFMAETAKILSPHKKVLIPDLAAGCSLADSCTAAEFEVFVKQHPQHTVVSYVNTSAEIKALSDIICTSSNARQIVESLPPHEKIIFAPDQNLGRYINQQTQREMVLWQGSCHVHRQFSLERIKQLLDLHPEAKLIAHPECQQPILLISDYIGSTAALLKYTISDVGSKYIVATESGILHQMKKANPTKTFLPAPPDDSTCACNDCNYMKINTMQKLHDCLKSESPEIKLDPKLIERAYKPIKRMLDISKKLGL